MEAKTIEQRLGDQPNDRDREIARLNAEIERLASQASNVGETCGELRSERDEARAQLAQAQERLAACEPVIEAVRAIQKAAQDGDADVVSGLETDLELMPLPPKKGPTP